MGLLERIFGRGQTRLAQDVGAVRVPRPALPSEFKAYYLASNSRIAVVGESHYQAALREAAHGKWSEDGIEIQACISREPDNKYDRNAVRVDVNGNTVGYISRDEAPLLQAKLRDLESHGLRPICRARIFGGSPDKPSYGIVLHASHSLAGISNEMPSGNSLRLEGSWLTSVTGEEDHQDVLELFAPKDRDSVAYVFASLAICTIARGKYVGQQALEVRVDGQRVGQLTKAMTERYWSDVQPALIAGRTVVTEALVSREDKKIEISLFMPEHR